MRIIREGAVERASVPRAFVPTMGSLHEGHRALMQEARKRVGERGEVVVSVFVNPTQFGDGEDFDAYPRDLDADIRVCEEEGVDILFAPSVSGIYGELTLRAEPKVTVDPGPLGAQWEGAERPGHFTGVLTVVSILFHKVAADIAMFGQKDYQQLVLVERMSRELAFGIEIVGVPTIRDHDGLALSSRNLYLDDEQRRRAAAIPQALEAARRKASQGAGQAIDAARLVLVQSGLDVDYVDVCAPDLGPAPTAGAARLLIAARVGPVRLIDNCELTLGRTVQ